ncbi:hypothetical protein BDV93DRAFT_117285 [Ceratobasidium sp. AG-I]|nr:hypothetical protein BDV93DRAFT_117285 [Ceratobasidium sp. AG-I]
MRQRGIRFPQMSPTQSSSTRSSKHPRSSPTQPQTPASVSPLAAITLLLMQGAPSHEAAFKMYAYARVVDPGSGTFGAKEYRQALRVFAELRIARRHEDVWKDGSGDNWVDRAAVVAGKAREEVYAPPPAALYYEIMRDMQRAGFEVGVADYTSILKSYAAVCIPVDAGSKPESAGFAPDGNQPPAPVASGFARAHNGHVVEHIQRIHTLLKLDTNLTPDIGLLNALMNAYGYAGALENALAIWDQIRPAARDGASISIILDALGHAGPTALPRAKQLWKSLRQKQGSRLNVNHYTSWVEALCRMGEFDEAEKVVFVDMRDKVRPDEKTLRTLVSFAWRVGRQAQVLERVRREFPGVV